MEEQRRHPPTTSPDHPSPSSPPCSSASLYQGISDFLLKFALQNPSALVHNADGSSFVQIPIYGPSPVTPASDNMGGIPAAQPAPNGTFTPQHMQ
eukprot:4848172-Prorocentrum_lima.AAC.1